MFACIYIPDFPVQASLLSESPEKRIALNRAPVVILDGPANLPRVFATNTAARRAGIESGMTKLQAEVCAGAVLRKRSREEELSAQAALLDCAATFSPRVESTMPGAAILDLTGTEKLFSREKSDPQKIWRQLNRSKAPWPRAVQAMTAKTAEAGFDVRIAIAPSPDTAFLAARGFPANTIIPAGGEVQCLAPLSIKTLPASSAILETLNSWGICTFQALAALPAVAIVERLGQEGLYLQKLACGVIARPLLMIEPNAEFTASFEFDDPVETLESIFFILNRLLHELCSRLLSTAQAASELRLTVGLNVRQLHMPHPVNRSIERVRLQPGQLLAPQLALASEGTRPSVRIEETRIHDAEQDRYSKHAWKLPVPTQEKNLLFSLIRLHLEKTTFSAPVRCLRLEVIPVKPRVAQGNLFAPPAPAEEKLEITLERIRGVVGVIDADGTECVGSPQLLDTHKPDSFTLQRLRITEAHSSPSKKLSSSKHSVAKEIPKMSPVEPRVPRSSRLLPGPGPPSATSTSTRSAPVIALRIFRPALETSVELDGENPHFVRLWNRHRRVFAASGPWSASGNWWNVSAWMREEWDVALQTPAGLGFYRIYRNRLQDRWFVEGVFD